MMNLMRPAARALVALAVASIVVGHAQTPTSGIDGTVRDLQGIPMEGVTITATSSGEPHKETTDARGRYWLQDLPAATYQVSAESGGLRKSVALVVLSAGREAECNFAMSWLPNTQNTHPTPGGELPRAVQAAAVIVHLRVAQVLGPRLAGPSQALLATEHVGVVVNLLRGAGPALVPNGLFHFWQMQAGEWPANGHTFVGENTPYKAGDELIGLFDQDVDQLIEFAGGSFMFPVVDGKIQWPPRLGRERPPGIQDGMPVAAFESAIFKLIIAGR